MNVNVNENNGKMEVRFDNKVLNYVFIDEPDTEEMYRLAVELTADEAEKLAAALMNSDLSARQKECLEGGQMLNAKTKYEPVKAALTKDPEFYSGCIGSIVVAPYRYQYRDKGRNYTGIAYGLRAVLKTDEGERLAQTKKASDYFGDLMGAAQNEPF